MESTQRGKADIRNKLQVAGDRLRAAETARRAAVENLKDTVVEADGGVSVADAAGLTGLPGEVLQTFQPDFGSEIDAPRAPGN